MPDKHVDDEAQRLKIFISYSRKDSEFMNIVAEKLLSSGYLPDFDNSENDENNTETGISAEDEWWVRLQEMIASSDIFLLLVSPNSAASRVVDDEIIYARSLGKRAVSVLISFVDFGNVPPKLAAQNVKIDFTEDGPGLDAAFDSLRKVLDTNVPWRRSIRALSIRAGDWWRSGKPDSMLLRTGAIKQYEHLLDNRPKNEPEPGAIITSFLSESRQKEMRDAKIRRRLKYSAIFATFSIILGILSYIYEQDIYRESMRALHFKHLNLTPDTIEHLQQVLECDIESTCPRIVALQGGTFGMGDPTEAWPAEHPYTKVTVKPFAIGKTEVTKAQWDTCVRLSGSDLIKAPTNSERLPYGCKENKSTLELSQTSPIVNVSQTEAIGYIRWLNYMTNGNPDKPYRLPTEAEWEYAARGDTTTLYPWGSKENDACKFANMANPETAVRFPRVRVPFDCPNNYLSISPVSSFQANRFGLFDMQGNVWEWTLDCHRNNLTENAYTILERNCTTSAIRGGAWDTRLSTLRSSFRYWWDRSKSADTIGFRVVRDITSEKLENVQ